MITQNRFSRTMVNEGKMGAYYTDLSHCTDIGKMFAFPDEEVCVLEPSIGDGSAVSAVTGAKNNQNIRIFGVELNDAVADETAKNPVFEDILKADFLNGVKISHGAFTFAFGNPPYMTDSICDGTGRPIRFERLFLEKIGYYLAKDAVLVWVIPYNVFVQESYFRYWNSRYETLAFYKFRPDEFAKFHQVVIVGRKRKLSCMFSKEKMGEMLSQVTPLEKVEELPHDFDKKIEVLPSSAKDVTLFASMEFDEEAAKAALVELPKDIGEFFQAKAQVESYVINEMGNPPMPLKKDSMYLLATSGGGQGITGSEETMDIHLQRGVAEVIEEGEVEQRGTSDKRQVRITSRTQITMSIVQNDGTITTLQ